MLKQGGTGPLPLMEVIENFLKRTYPNNDCIELAASKGHRYPTVAFAGIQIVSNRFAYVLFNGRIPTGHLALHKCDNPKCVNPDHLFIGTHQDNSDDKFSKGRQRPIKGEQVNTCKITESQACEIRRRAISGENQKLLGTEFGITQGAVSLIKRGKNWKHI